MHAIKRILLEKAAIHQAVSRLLPQVLGFLLSVVIVRFIGLEVMGQYAQYTALIMMTFGVLASGITTDYLRSKSIRGFKDGALSMMLSGFAVILIVVPAYSLSNGASILGVSSFLIAIFLMRLTDLYVVMLRLLNKDKYAILPKTIPLVILLTIIIVVKPTGIDGLGLIFVISWTSVVPFLLSSRALFRKMAISFRRAFSNLKSSIVISGTLLATQIYGNVDQFLIANIINDEASGLYRVAVSFSVLVMPVIGVFSYIYLSRLNRLLNSQNLIEIRKNFFSQLLVNFIISSSYFLFCLFFLRYILPFLYGEGVADAVSSGIVLSLGIVFNTMAMVFSYSLLAIKKEKPVFFIALLGALINVLSNFLFISNYGLIGGAISSALTQFFILCLLSYCTIFRYKFLSSISA